MSKAKLLKKHSSLDAKKARSGYLFVLPFLLGVVLIYLPILLDSVWFSFNQIKPTTGLPEMIPQGLYYYKQALVTDTSYTGKLLSSLQELLIQVPAILVFSLFIAVVLNQKMLGRAAFRAIFFVPVIIATGLMDSINAADLYSEVAEGGINDGSEGTDTDQVISAMDVELIFSMMQVGGGMVEIVTKLVNDVFNIVNYSGVQMLIFLAGLQSISPSIYEACQIEGATAWETFWKITFPMISPMILVNGFYTIIDSFTRSTNSVMSYINSLLDSSLRTAMSWIYFLIVILVVAIVGGIGSAFVFYQRRD